MSITEGNLLRNMEIVILQSNDLQRKIDPGALLRVTVNYKSYFVTFKSCFSYKH